MSWRVRGLSVGLVTVLLFSSSPSWGGSVRSSSEAQELIRPLLARGRSAAKIGPVRDAGQYYEVELVTSKGTLVDRILVQKASGNVRSLYGSMLVSLTASAPAQVPRGS